MSDEKTVLLVFGAKSGVLRRIIILDEGDSIDAHKIFPGEDMVVTREVVSDPMRFSVDRAEAIVRARRGIDKAHSGKCVVFHKDTGDAINAIMADPEIDKHLDGHPIVQDDDAHDTWKHGWKLENGRPKPSVAAADEVARRKGAQAPQRKP